jgi:hypothetical protein
MGGQRVKLDEVSKWYIGWKQQIPEAFAKVFDYYYNKLTLNKKHVQVKTRASEKLLFDFF